MRNNKRSLSFDCLDGRALMGGLPRIEGPPTPGSPEPIAPVPPTPPVNPDDPGSPPTSDPTAPGGTTEPK